MGTVRGRLVILFFFRSFTRAYLVPALTRARHRGHTALHKQIRSYKRYIFTTADYVQHEHIILRVQ